MHDIVERFKVLRVIPVIAIDRSEDAMRLADTLVEGGLPCVEITFRTAAAIDAIRLLSKRDDILVGVGTVLTIDQVKAAMDSGARFIVSPGFNPKVADYCVKNNIVHIPGICTPSDTEAAISLGLNVLKFFPAEAFGGLKTLKAISGPYQDLTFIPTGGINPGNLVDYIRFSKVLACGGTWIAESKLISAGRFDEILKNTQNTVKILQNA
ncbi:MAG: bifunctional 4-hydroxy-2-oxoglutarate aldolase/2-dehydro-3-deoxy-phosphogluconate aldolase [Desulfobacterales bacterium]|nr:bifunctional 4-hydroxy-2-oxoglutarate aldolase/2-dehydro-3-deoxy-phosphogluconate aldolase [Desulfobacterales bacterium]